MKFRMVPLRFDGQRRHANRHYYLIPDWCRFCGCWQWLSLHLTAAAHKRAAPRALLGLSTFISGGLGALENPHPMTCCESTRSPSGPRA
jgi:hypothetical protein